MRKRNIWVLLCMVCAVGLVTSCAKVSSAQNSESMLNVELEFVKDSGSESVGVSGADETSDETLTQTGADVSGSGSELIEQEVGTDVVLEQGGAGSESVPKEVVEDTENGKEDLPGLTSILITGEDANQLTLVEVDQKLQQYFSELVANNDLLDGLSDDLSDFDASIICDEVFLNSSLISVELSKYPEIPEYQDLMDLLSESSERLGQACMYLTDWYTNHNEESKVCGQEFLEQYEDAMIRTMQAFGM